MKQKQHTPTNDILYPDYDTAGGTAKISLGNDHPIKIFTWLGGKTLKVDIWDNQSKLKQCNGDTEDVDSYPNSDSLAKLEDCDIGYIHNHGGVLTTSALSGNVDIRVEGLGFPQEEHKGPSLILFYGCNTGKESYAKGFGILPDSKTKAYIGLKYEPFMAGSKSDTFQETFFRELAGDATIEDACRRAYDKVKRKKSPLPFKDMICIVGAGNMTLKDIRSNLKKRSSFHNPKKPFSKGCRCGAVCNDFEKYGFCDRPVSEPGKKCHDH